MSTVISEINTITKITINRPEALNALSREVIGELQEAISQVSHNKEVKVVILRGAGDKAFVAGADILEMRSLSKDELAGYIQAGQDLMDSIENSPKVFIAAVDGFALGGGFELALACDIICASKSAKVGLPEVSLGLIPAFAGTQRLSQRCGVGRAKKYIFTAQFLNAEDAFADNAIDYLFQDQEFGSSVEELAQTIAYQSTEAIRNAKKVLSKTDFISQGLEQEKTLFLESIATKDASVRMDNFLNKNKK